MTAACKIGWGECDTCHVVPNLFRTTIPDFHWLVLVFKNFTKFNFELFFEVKERPNLSTFYNCTQQQQQHCVQCRKSPKNEISLHPNGQHTVYTYVTEYVHPPELLYEVYRNQYLPQPTWRMVLDKMWTEFPTSDAKHYTVQWLVKQGKSAKTISFFFSFQFFCILKDGQRSFKKYRCDVQ